MILETYSYTSRGGRENNEDYVCYDSHRDFGVWTLSDGLGGHNSGEVASRLAATLITEDIKAMPQVTENSLLNTIDKANRLILSRQRDDAQKGMRTTVVTAFIRDNSFHYLNVGDSRMYYFKNGCIYMQSRDHSICQVAVDLGEISRADVRFHDDRNKLLKVLGDSEDLGVLQVDDPIPVEAGDAFLLCSDGFWEYVFETEMEIDLLKSATPRQWLEFMIKRLVLRVTGNNDNFSVIGCLIT